MARMQAPPTQGLRIKTRTGAQAGPQRQAEAEKCAAAKRTADAEKDVQRKAEALAETTDGKTAAKPKAARASAAPPT